jgi:hypothetical protein
MRALGDGMLRAVSSRRASRVVAAVQPVAELQVPRPSCSRSGGTSMDVPPDPEARPTLVRSDCIASVKGAA